MIAVGLMCRLAFVFLTPIFQAPDEEEHWSYIQKLESERSFPVMRGMGGDAEKDWEYEQPPLYYLLLAPVVGAAQGAGLGQEAMVHLFRLSSVMLWAVNVWLCTVLLRRLQVKDGFTWVFVLGMVTLLPTYTFVSSAINNDNLMAVFGSALLCVLAARGTSVLRAVGLGLLLGLALLTKKAALVFFPAVVLLPLFDLWHNRTTWRPALVQVVVPMTLALMMLTPWAWRDWHVYGTLNPEVLAAPRKVWPSMIYGVASAVHNFVKTFAAVSGLSNNIGYPLPIPGECLLLLACVPGRWWPNRSPVAPRGDEGDSSTQLVFFLIAGINILLVVRFGYLLGMGQGRHVFAVLIPIALFLATRLRRLSFAGLELAATGFWVVYAVVFTACSLAQLR